MATPQVGARRAHPIGQFRLHNSLLTQIQGEHDILAMTGLDLRSTHQGTQSAQSVAPHQPTTRMPPEERIIVSLDAGYPVALEVHVAEHMGRKLPIRIGSLQSPLQNEPGPAFPLQLPGLLLRQTGLQEHISSAAGLAHPPGIEIRIPTRKLSKTIVQGRCRLGKAGHFRVYGHPITHLQGSQHPSLAIVDRPAPCGNVHMPIGLLLAQLAPPEALEELNLHKTPEQDRETQQKNQPHQKEATPHLNGFFAHCSK
jgi:hypothetical protein